MNSIILRYVTLSQGDSNFEIVGSAEDGGDIFVQLQAYLQKNKIKCTDEIPQEDGLYCVKNADDYIVSSWRYVNDWQIKDEKPAGTVNEPTPVPINDVSKVVFTTVLVDV